MANLYAMKAAAKFQEHILRSDVLKVVKIQFHVNIIVKKYKKFLYFFGR